MQQLIDISGQKFNKLLVIKLDHISRRNGKTRTYWLCKCDCGNTTILRKDEFIYSYSKVKSCGCWHKEESKNRPKDKRNGRFIKINKEDQ